MSANRLEQWSGASELTWLEQVLAERFGQAFELTRLDDRIRLTCPASPGHIELACFDSWPGAASGGLPFTCWDASHSGWNVALQAKLPAPGVAELPVELIRQSPEGFVIDYDILGLTYWMLSRCEEIEHGQGDRYGRFPTEASHAYQHGYLERPVVDEWLFILRQVVQRQWPTLRLRPLQYSMRVSHDVDEPSRYAFKSLRGLARVVAIDVLRHRDWLAPIRALYIKLKGRSELAAVDPANTFDWLMDLSERHGLVSAFYFICGRTHPTMDADYEPETPAIRRLIRRIHGRGHEIGLHPSFNTYLQPGLIVGEADRLRRVCAEEQVRQAVWGGRMHYLRWSHPLTLRAWDQAGMTYDSTLGYADLSGFRCGTCHEYPAFDPVARQALELRIRPLVAMEVTVTSPTYMGLGCGPGAVARFAGLIDACRAVGGCFTLLWHNSNLSTSAERALYEKVLELGAVKTNA
ncbi:MULTISPECIES: polysaccharide deacetylase family protein [Pseudomonas]|uniref:DUF7033 domain-containing protein n=1 Tax=Pseudomonas mosselii TaxID=78327 RepID=A0A5R8Z5T5_9PSED|nr:polysaccharide deacetylase family protein [Pseudomonas mosselii]TLP61162.1 hypothetical protein FEM01_11270 [Pseudomonas mosselii]